MSRASAKPSWASSTSRASCSARPVTAPGSAHVKAGGGRGVGGLVSFRVDDTTREPKQNNAICLGCHERGDRTYWSGSPHETRDVACTNCHTIMKRVSVKFNLKTELEPETCFQCHKDRRARNGPFVPHAAARRQDGVLRLP